MLHQRARHSIFWCLSSAPRNTLLMKYIGFSPESESWTSMELMVLSDMDGYKNIMALVVGWCRIGGLDKKDFILLKGSSHSGVHSKFSFLMDAKKEKALLPTHERKRDKAANLPVTIWTSLILDGLLMLMMAWNLSGLVSMPLRVRRKPKNFPAWTPKVHLARFSRMLYCLTYCRISSRSSVWLSSSFVLTTRSSM